MTAKKKATDKAFSGVREVELDAVLPEAKPLFSGFVAVGVATAPFVLWDGSGVGASPEDALLSLRNDLEASGAVVLESSIRVFEIRP